MKNMRNQVLQVLQVFVERTTQVQSKKEQEEQISWGRIWQEDSRKQGDFDQNDMKETTGGYTQMELNMALIVV